MARGRFLIAIIVAASLTVISVLISSAIYQSEDDYAAKLAETGRRERVGRGGRVVNEHDLRKMRAKELEKNEHNAAVLSSFQLSSEHEYDEGRRTHYSSAGDDESEEVGDGAEKPTATYMELYEKDASAWSYKRVMVERSIEQARAFIDPDRWKAAAKIRTSEQRALLHGKEWNQGKQMDYYSESDGNRAHEEDIAVLNAVFNSHRFPVCDTWIAEGGEALSESGGGDALPLIDDASCGSPVNSSAPPHFIVLGAMKAGTDFLFNALQTHPNVLPLKKAKWRNKEIHFFNEKSAYLRGLPFYREHFNVQNDSISGEASPPYLYSFDRRNSAIQLISRIRSMVPDAKLLLLLRDPLERTLSHLRYDSTTLETAWQQWIQPELDGLAACRGASPFNVSVSASPFPPFPYYGGVAGMDCVSLIANAPPRPYVTASLYAQQLQNVLRVFPRRQVMVIHSASLFADPVRVMRRVFAFLCLPPPLATVEAALQALPVANAAKHTSLSVSSMSRTLLLQETFRPYDAPLWSLMQCRFEWDTRELPTKMSHRRPCENRFCEGMGNFVSFRSPEAATTCVPHVVVYGASPFFRASACDNSSAAAEPLSSAASLLIAELLSRTYIDKDTPESSSNSTTHSGDLLHYGSQWRDAVACDVLQDLSFRVTVPYSSSTLQWRHSGAWGYGECPHTREQLPHRVVLHSPSALSASVLAPAVSTRLHHLLPLQRAVVVVEEPAARLVGLFRTLREQMSDVVGEVAAQEYVDGSYAAVEEEMARITLCWTSDEDLDAKCLLEQVSPFCRWSFSSSAARTEENRPFSPLLCPSDALYSLQVLQLQQLLRRDRVIVVDAHRFHTSEWAEACQHHHTTGVSEVFDQIEAVAVALGLPASAVSAVDACTTVQAAASIPTTTLSSPLSTHEKRMMQRFEEFYAPFNRHLFAAIGHSFKEWTV